MRAEVLSSNIPTELDSFPPNQISSASVDVECPNATTAASTIFTMKRILSSFPTARSLFTQEEGRCRHTLFFTLRIELIFLAVVDHRTKGRRFWGKGEREEIVTVAGFTIRSLIPMVTRLGDQFIAS